MSLEDHRRLVWGLCYRMTGIAADADDLVQEAFLRAIQHPPHDVTRERPWVIKIAMNLARDHLRRRRRQSYVGPWLPSPIETEPEDPGAEPEARYTQLESVTMAFLLALEALKPQPRAVLLLRDVFGYSVRDTAQAMDMSESNVKTTLLRARRVMAGYDRTRPRALGSLQDETRHALERFMTNLAADDVGGIVAQLRADAVTFNDSGGQYMAARVPIVGADKVARFYLGLTHKRITTSFRVAMLNGLPALIAETTSSVERVAPRFVFQIDVVDGLIGRIYLTLADGKLTAV
jgi:RNA polymerase sigma-70 factor (ECF subfamily)